VHDDDGGQKEGERPAFFPRRQRGLSGRPRAVALVAVLVLLAGGGVWYWLASRDGSETTIRGGDLGEPPPARAAPADSAADLPPLDASDALVRDLVAGLSSRPRLAEWLATDRLVRRFVGAVVSVAAGTSPRDELAFLDPDGAFEVRGSRADGDGAAADDEPATGDSVAGDGSGAAGRPAVIDPASYDRYDPVATTIASLDTEGTAEIYRRLRPLFREAYRELGFSEGSFDGTLARAVENLLAVPVPEEPVEVVPAAEGTDWVYRNPDLEGLSPAQKHLLRMGPENVHRVQAKLRELAGALDLPLVELRGRGGSDAGPGTPPGRESPGP
jgi:hypothetical protein